MLTMQTMRALCAAALTVGLAAQCPFQTLATTGYGAGCSPVFPGQTPTLSAALDPAACALTVTVGAFGGCCNTFAVGRVLALGDQPANVPLPQFGAGCTLLVQPAILLFLPSAAGDTFSLPLAAALPPLTVYAQGAVLYFTTIGFSTDFALTAGARFDLS